MSAGAHTLLLETPQLQLSCACLHLHTPVCAGDTYAEIAEAAGSAADPDGSYLHVEGAAATF